MQSPGPKKSFEGWCKRAEDRRYAIKAHGRQQNRASAETVGDGTIDKLHEAECKNIAAEHEVRAAGANPEVVAQCRDPGGKRIGADWICGYE